MVDKLKEQSPVQSSERILPESLRAYDKEITPIKHVEMEDKTSVFQSAGINSDEVKLESDLPYSSAVPNSQNQNSSYFAATKLTDSHVLFGIRKES